MSFDLFHRIAELDALDCSLFYDSQFQRFAAKREFSLHGFRFSHRTQVRGVCQAWMEKPIPGVATLLGYRAEGDHLCGIFEVLPGHRLDSLMGSAGKIPIPDWVDWRRK